MLEEKSSKFLQNIQKENIKIEFSILACPYLILKTILLYNIVQTIPAEFAPLTFSLINCYFNLLKQSKIFIVAMWYCLSKYNFCNRK